MTKFHYYKCDCCGKVLENVEGSKKQLMFTLIANYDTDVEKYKAHFCGRKCLEKFIKKVVEHKNLPVVSSKVYIKARETYGEVSEGKEREVTPKIKEG